jgi:large subunit ribosomal protein L24
MAKADKKKKEKPKKHGKVRVKKGDTVYVLAGKDRGASGKVLSVDPATRRATIEGINLVKRHRKEGQSGGGGITEMPAPIDLSNLVVVCPHCKSHMRPSKKTIDKDREGRTKHFHVRLCRKCGEQLDQV